MFVMALVVAVIGWYAMVMGATGEQADNPAVASTTPIGLPAMVTPTVPTSSVHVAGAALDAGEVERWIIVNGAEKLGHWGGGIVYHLPDDLGP